MFFIDDDDDAAWEQERERNRNHKKPRPRGFDMIHAAKLIREMLAELSIPTMNRKQQEQYDKRTNKKTK